MKCLGLATWYHTSYDPDLDLKNIAEAAYATILEKGLETF